MSIKSTLLIAALGLFSATLAAPAAHDHSDHDHVSYSRRGGAFGNRDWHQDPNSPSAQLFKRAVTGTPGSTEWAANYPTPGATPTSVPQAWLDRLYQVTNSSVFPTYGPSSLNNGYPTYSNGLSGTDPAVCSFTYQCIDSTDAMSVPEGWIGINFDDGPTTYSPTLYAFLEENNISATHFMIGGNIVYNTAAFQRAVSDGGHIAVHTWSHPYMTPLTNEQIVAELGWTAQIIADNNGGRVPAFWRPPYGDADMRVRYIAMEVFGLRTVPWHKDTGDWAIGSNAAYTVAGVVDTYTSWLNSTNRAGWIGLEHEASQADIDVFMAAYPIMMAHNWTLGNVAEVNHMWEYANAATGGNTTETAPDSIIQTAAPGNITTYDLKLDATDTSSVAASTTAIASTAAASQSTAAAGTGATSAATAASVSRASATASPAATSVGAANTLKPVVGVVGTILALALGLLA